MSRPAWRQVYRRLGRESTKTPKLGEDPDAPFCALRTGHPRSPDWSIRTIASARIRGSFDSGFDYTLLISSFFFFER